MDGFIASFSASLRTLTGLSRRNIPALPTWPMGMRKTVLPSNAAKAEEMVMANAIVTEFDKIEAWFKSWWKKLPAWNVVAMSALNVAAPLVETILDLVDPAAAGVIEPIITEIQSKFGTAASLISSANTTNLSTTLTSITTQLPTLLSLANITNPASIAKASAAVTTISSEIEAILASIPSASVGTA